MNPENSISFSNSMDYSNPALPFPNLMDHSHPARSFPNSMNYSNPAIINNEEHHPQQFPNTNLPMFNHGVSNGMSNVGHLEVVNGMSNGGQSGGSNVGQSGESSVGQFSGPRQRGRPRGSKNKPKNNGLQMTSTMKSIVLEIPPGTEVIEWLKQFAHSKNFFMNVVGGSGIVSQAAISGMSPEHPSIFFEELCLISFSGKVSPSEPSACSFSASFARMNRDVIGGTFWRLVTLGPMLVTALISKIPEVFGADYATSA